jgi:hypothetical protein
MLAAAYQVPHDSAFDDFTLIVNTICERTGIPTKEFPTGGWGAVARIVGQLLVDKGSLNRVARTITRWPKAFARPWRDRSTVFTRRWKRKTWSSVC